MFTVVCASDSPYMLWQLEVQIYNMKTTQTHSTFAQYYIVLIYEKRPSTRALLLALKLNKMSNLVLVNLDSVDVSIKKKIFTYHALAKCFGLQYFCKRKLQSRLDAKGITIFLIDPDVLFTKDFHQAFMPLLNVQSEHQIKCWATTCPYISYQCMENNGIKPENGDLGKRYISRKICAKWNNLGKQNGGAQYLFCLPSIKSINDDKGTENSDNVYRFFESYLSDVFHSSWDYYSKLNQSNANKVNELDKAKSVSDGKADNNEIATVILVPKAVVWCAEMLGFLLQTLSKKNEKQIVMKTHPLLDHLLADDIMNDPKNISKFIIHLSGNMKTAGMFDKSLFTKSSPWSPQNLSLLQAVNKTETASYLYMTWALRSRIPAFTRNIDVKL